MMQSRRLKVGLAALISAGLVLGAIPVAHADEWTPARTVAVNYRQVQEKVRAEVLSELNRMRSEPRSCGDRDFPAAPPLTLDSALNNAAYLHSQDMAINGYFAHVSLDGRTPAERVTAAATSGGPRVRTSRPATRMLGTWLPAGWKALAIAATS